MTAGILALLFVLAGVIMTGVGALLIWSGTTDPTLALELIGFGAMVGFIGVLVGGVTGWGWRP